MNFNHHALGFQPAGTVVTVTLSGTEANVQLVDELNFRAYKAGQGHRFYGGHARRSPIVLTIPTDGSWHVVVDLGGFGGQVRSSIRINRPTRTAL